MRTIIVGCGRVGAGIARKLEAEGHDVTILDTSNSAFGRLDHSFRGQALRGDGTDESVLRRAGAEGADCFFALTEGDNRNVLAAQLAAETFGIPRVLAKINDPVRAKAYAAMGIDTINRTEMMIDAIERYLGRPGTPGVTDVLKARDPEPGPGGPASGQPAPKPPAAPTTSGGR
jgi:trk system potassium uptake protein TrkA